MQADSTLPVEANGRAIDTKHCKWCNTTKPLSSFHNHKEMKDGKLNKCNTCVFANVQQWRLAGKRNGAEEARKYALKYPAKRASQKRKMYMTRKLSMKTSWSEFDNLFFEEIYDLAKLRTKMTGVEWHVDHIVPLQHKYVCGLHVPANLQCIPAKINLIKGNSFDGIPKHRTN